MRILELLARLNPARTASSTRGCLHAAAALVSEARGLQAALATMQERGEEEMFHSVLGAACSTSRSNNRSRVSPRPITASGRSRGSRDGTGQGVVWLPRACCWEASSMTDEEFVALEREGWDALSGSQGADHYRRVLTEDALMAFPFGVIDRAQALEAIAAAPPWSSYEMTSPRVVRLGEDAAVVVYAVSARREGQPEFTAVASSTFLRQGSDWQLAFHQQSPSR